MKSIFINRNTTSSRPPNSISDVTGLTDALNNKSNVGHIHPISEVTNLQSSLDNKANSIHNHVITDVTNLQTSLNGKSDIGHSHVIADVTNLQTSLDNKANLIHNHVISDVSGLQSAIDSKSDIGHSHVIADVTNLQTSLDGKSDIGHSHVIADVTGLQSELDSKTSIFSNDGILSGNRALDGGGNDLLIWKCKDISIVSDNQGAPINLLNQGGGISLTAVAGGTKQFAMDTSAMTFNSNAFIFQNGDINVVNNKIYNLSNGVSAGDAVNKGQLDDRIPDNTSGLDYDILISVPSITPNPFWTQFNSILTAGNMYSPTNFTTPLSVGVLQNVWTEIPSLLTNNLINCSPSANGLQVGLAGVFFVSLSLTIRESSGSSDLLEFGIRVNNSNPVNNQSLGGLDISNIYFNSCFSTTINLSVGDVIKPVIRDISSSGTLQIASMHFTITKIGTN